jgi:hypothetical protein
MSREHATRSLTVGAVVLVGLAAAQPLLSGRLPWAADTLIHLYRLVELDHLLRQGYLFSRWAPDLAYGYGFPLFNFYAPLSYYAAEILRLLGMDFAPALLTAFVALIIVAGLSMYAWAADVFGQRAGIVAAAAFVTAPYLLYNVYHRGALAEMLAVALMPAILWAMTRLAQSGARKFFVLTTLLYAALVFGHNITALVFTPVIVLYAGLQFAGGGIRDTRSLFRIPYSVLRVALALLLGVGLVAFFWVPMFLELSSVQIVQVFMPEVFDYHHNFVTLGELLSPPMTVDPNLVLPPTPRSVGLIPLMLATIALATGWRRWNRLQRIVLVFAALVTLVGLFLTLPQSVVMWDALPVLRFVQFPWRFLGLVSLGVAFLAGSAFSDKGPSRGGSEARSDRVAIRRLSFVVRHPLLVALVISGCIVYGFAWQYVPYLEPIVRPTVADIAHYERESGALGTTSAGDYLPNTVKTLPDANALVVRYARSEVIERLNLASLPPDAQVLTSRYRPLSADVTVETLVPFVAVFDVFAFAGWQARVDGQPIAITPTDPHGLISFPVPAGRHHLEIFFGSTLLRSVASLGSLLSALALIAATLVLCTDRRPETANRRPLSTVEGQRSAVVAPALVCFLALGLLACKSFYLDARESVFRRTRFDGTQVAGVARPLSVNFDNQMVLMGIEPAAPVAEVGGSVRLALYWRAARRLETDYSISAQLVDERGFVYGQRDSQHPGGYPTSRWTLYEYARDVHDMALAPGTPPGEYRLRVGVYRVGTPGGLNILDANNAPSGTMLDVATISVTRPRGIIPSKLEMPRPDHLSGATLAPGIVLLGYDMPQTEVNVGAKLSFTLYWQATATQARDLRARLQLADAGGVAVFSADVPPISPQFPTGRLLAGDAMRGPNAAGIPALTPGGAFVLRLALVDESGVVQGDTVELGRVVVRVPQRTMVEPGVEQPAQADLGGGVRLIGYDLSAARLVPGATLTVTLYWQAQREILYDYRAFVHLLDASGRFVVGGDAIPVNWTRPTTGWIPGEYITDPHTLTLPGSLPPGDYRLEAGMYEADSGVRLGERVLLDQPVTIGP